MITPKTYKALKVLENTSPLSPMAANFFACRLWGKDEDKKHLFLAVTNIGNGACSGKKAWLCAGSLLGKLAKRGLVKWVPRIKGYCPDGYCLTNIGREELLQYEKKQTNIAPVSKGRPNDTGQSLYRT